MNEKPIIFISYSHNDESWMDRLKIHLGVLYWQGLCEIWDDQRILGGGDFTGDIEAAINSSKISILLISPDYLASEFINSNEIPRLLEKKKKDDLVIYPIIVRPCAWKHVKWLKDLLIRPKDARPLSGGNDHEIDNDLANIVEEIGDMIKKMNILIEDVIENREIRETYMPKPLDSIRIKQVNIFEFEP